MKKKKTFPSRTINYWVMILPALIWMLAVNIVPMFGVVMAFQDFNPGKGSLVRNLWDLRISDICFR